MSTDERERSTGRAALHDTRITIERPNPTATADASGRVDLSDDANWIVHATEYGKVRREKEQESDRASGKEQTRGLVIEFYSTPATRQIDATYRFRIGSRTLYCRTAYETEARRPVVLCEAGETV